VEVYPEVFLCRRVLHRVVNQIQQRTRNRFAIHTHLWQVAVDLLFELKPVLLDFKTIRFERAPHQIGHIGFAEAIFFFARLDTRIRKAVRKKWLLMFAIVVPYSLIPKTSPGKTPSKARSTSGEPPSQQIEAAKGSWSFAVRTIITG